MTARPWLDLTEALRRRLARHRDRADDVGAEASRVLSLLSPLPSAFAPPPPGNHAVLGYLPAALALARRHDPALIDRLAPLATLLPWRYGYVPRADAPGLEARMAWAELVGPAAPLRSGEVCLGLTLIGPHTLYPAHHHPAVELYDVVAGHAAWTAGDLTRIRPPGDVILHAAHEVHAMGTADEPLLAVYAWTGDVVSPSVYAADS